MSDSPINPKGIVYTRRWISDFMLDLAGYTPDQDLLAETIVEPCCGDGAFIVPMVERLVESAKRHGKQIISAARCIRAYDIDPQAANQSREAAMRVLVSTGLADDKATCLVNQWIRTGDFLLQDQDNLSVRWIVGNPPYVRAREIDPEIGKHYRMKWRTMGRRADLYIGFFEAALSILKSDGRVVYICADRWMKSAYGRQLRNLVSENNGLRLIIDLNEIDPFLDAVSTYPAITVIDRMPTDHTIVIHVDKSFNKDDTENLAIEFGSGDISGDSHRHNYQVQSQKLTPTIEGWPVAPDAKLKLITYLEATFPTLGEVDVRVRSGVATGADSIFIVSDSDLVEGSRLTKLVGPSDLADGSIQWQGRYLVNPWDGQDLVTLDRFPRLDHYFNKHRERLERRHVARMYPPDMPTE